jgi:hypothetical protein
VAYLLRSRLVQYTTPSLSFLVMDVRGASPFAEDRSFDFA